MRAACTVAALLAAMGGFACSQDPIAASRRHIERGDRFIEEGRHREAAIEYGNAVKKTPDSVEAHAKLAEASAKADDPSTAVRELLQVAELDPQNVSAQIRAGALYLLAGRLTDARDRAEAALTIAPDEPGAHLLLGQVFGALNEPEKSEASIREAVKLAPQSTDAHLALAQYEWAHGRRDEAEAACDRAHALDPSNPQANRCLALILMATGRAAAAESFWRAIAQHPDGDPFVLADYFIFEKRLEDAHRELESLRAIDSVQADTRLAAVSYQMGRRADADELLNHVLQSHPNDSAARVLRARIHAAERQYEAALGDLTAAQKAAPENAEATFVEGTVLELTHRDEAAIAAYQKTIKLDPYAALAALAIARIRLGQGHPEDVPAWADRAWQAQPRDLPVRLAAVQLLLAAGRLADAENRARQLVEEMPDTPIVHVQLGTILQGAGRFDEARQAVSRGLAADPDSIDALAALSMIDAADGRVDEARTRLAQRLRRNPESPQLLVLAARLAADSGAARDGEALARRAIEADPGNVSAFLLLGDIYLRERRLDDALQQFEQAAQQGGDASPARTMVAVILESLGRAADAGKQYERILAANPRAGVAANNLAWLHLQNNQLDEALRLALVAREELRSSPEIADTLGWIYVSKRQHADAIRLLAESVAARPDNPTYRYHLGVAFLQAGDVNNARKELERAVGSEKEFPGRPEAVRALTDLELEIAR